MPYVTNPYVPESFLFDGYNTAALEPANPATSFPRGTPLELSTGKVAPATLNGSSKVASTALLYGIANEPFDASRYASGSTPIQQTKVNVTVLVPGVPFVATWHVDDSGGAANKIASSQIGTSVALKYDSAKKAYLATTYAAGDAVFTVVGLLDEPGTLYGKLIVIPDEANRIFK